MLFGKFFFSISSLLIYNLLYIGDCGRQLVQEFAILREKAFALIEGNLFRVLVAVNHGSDHCMLLAKFRQCNAVVKRVGVLADVAEIVAHSTEIAQIVKRDLLLLLLLLVLMLLLLLVLMVVLMRGCRSTQFVD